MDGNEIVPMELPDGTQIWVEGWEMEAQGRGVALVAAPDPAEAAKRLTSTIRGYTQLVTEALLEASQEMKPSKATVTFGVKIGGDYNVAIAKVSGEASVTVTAEWSFAPAAPQ
jgi:hypothetical protein